MMKHFGQSYSFPAVVMFVVALCRTFAMSCVAWSFSWRVQDLIFYLPYIST